VPLGLDVLETAARRILETTDSLLAIDRAVAENRTPPTNPGDHCRWCRRVGECDDAPDLVLAELNEILRPLDLNRFDPSFDDSPFNDDFETATGSSASSASSASGRSR